jgi:predicted dinucleotide-binding enzyme
MKIATIGRGNVGGGLADLWEKAGHDVHRLGSDGGDVAEAEAVLLAVPSGAIGDALERVSGLEGTTLIDATNIFEGERPGGLDSLAAYVKQTSGANVAKAFNTVFAALYDEVPKQRVPPSCLYCGEDAAKETTAACPRRRLRPGRRGRARERAPAGGLLRVSTAVSNAGLGRTFYRFAVPGEL